MDEELLGYWMTGKRAYTVAEELPGLLDDLEKGSHRGGGITWATR